MKSLLVLAAVAVGLVACSKQSGPVSVQVHPAVLAADATPAAAGWDTIHFEGSQRAVAGTYLVRPEPLFTEWNIIAFRTAELPDGSMAISARLNAHAAGKLGAFTSRDGSLKRPLAVRIGDRWADLSPVLSPMSDRVTLYGFTDAEAAALGHHVDNR